MFPREITSTRFWIRHELPMSSPLPLSLTDDLRNKIRCEHVYINNELLKKYVREERARLDLRWCLGEYFGCIDSNLVLGQLVLANIFGSLHMAYVTSIADTKITITLADQSGTDILVTSDDIYSARDAPSYDSFLAQHTVSHPQHIQDYVASEHQKRSLQLHEYIQCDLLITQHIYDIPELHWPDGTESWHFHDVKPRRKFFVKRIIHPLDLVDLCSTPTRPELELNSIDNSAKSVSMLDELPSSIKNLSYRSSITHNENLNLYFNQRPFHIVRTSNNIGLNQ